MLLGRYSCPLCCRNRHALHKCHALKTVYNISLKDHSSNTTNNGSSTSTPPVNQQPPVAANRVLASFTVISDEPESYDGFESVSVPPPISDDEDATTADTVDVVTDLMKVSKINESSTSCSPSFN